MSENQRKFLDYLAEWQSTLPVKSFPEICDKPEEVALLSVDLVNGFCSTGPLASPRVQAIVPAVSRLFQDARGYGIRNMVFTQDTHEPDAVEFGSFPPHCVRGTTESETIPELKALPFFDEIEIIEKNSIHSGINTGLQRWIEAHPQVSTYLVVGDCTDLCVYQLAMHLRLDANAGQKNRKVIVPEDCVATYDMPVDIAKSVGAFPHDGELLHTVFLYHMALNGIEVVKTILPASGSRQDL
jgi:nicotinamidase-related amidase